MPSLPLVLTLIALVLTVAAALNKAPVWTAMFVLCVALLLVVWR